jgi:hypothetical protein
MYNLILVLVIGISAIGMLIYKVLPLFRKTEESNAKDARIHYHRNYPKSSTQSRKLALGAIYNLQQEAYINSLETGVPPYAIREALSESWVINNREQALERLLYLRDKGYRFYQTTIFNAFFADSPEVQEAIILSNFSTEEDLSRAYSQLENLMYTVDELKADNIINDESDIPRIGVVAWDCGRLVFLSRLCYDVGYITENEAWAMINSADQLARQHFNDWEHYGKSYVLGRAMWGGLGCDNREIAGYSRDLLVLPTSPWLKMPW